jgi:hypothetical protein
MFRIGAALLAATLIVGLHTATAQTAATPDTAKPSRINLTMEKLRKMKAKWVANRPKLKACRAEVKAKGLTGDDRWFYIEDCMSKS